MKHLFPILLFICSLAPTYLQGQSTVGVLYNDSLAYDGYTLFTADSDENTYLIDNCGRLVNRWEHDTQVGLMAYLLENGDLLRTTRQSSDVFSGGGLGGLLQRFDWENNLLWQYAFADSLQHQHHDIAPLPNGNVLVLAWEYFSPVQAAIAGRAPLLGNNPVWSEKIVELEPIGIDSARIVWEWHIWDHLIQEQDASKENFGSVNEHPERIHLNFTPNSGNGAAGPDWLHANAVAYNPELDQIILNSRNFGEFWIIDHSTTTAEAASTSGGNAEKGGDLLYRWGNPQAYQRGNSFDQQLYLQHDAHWIPSGFPDAGKIIVFNNGTNRLGDDYSTVEIIAPPMTSGQYDDPGSYPFQPQYSEWRYPDQADLSFFAKNISGAQRLPNGNTLICDGPAGRFFEVDSAGNLHWDYESPIGLQGPVAQGDYPIANSAFRVLRYALDYPAFDGRDMTPGDVIELNGQPLCAPETPNTVLEFTPPTLLFPTLLQGDFLPINKGTNELFHIEIYDILGRQRFQLTTVDRQLQLPLSRLEKGIYFLRFSDGKGRLLLTKKFIKQ